VAHVVVIGAGIVGAAVADRLARAGTQVSVVDSGAPGSGTSGTSLAWTNANRKPPRSYHDFSVQSMRTWGELAGEFGAADWYVRSGNLAWVTTDAQREEQAARIARLREWDYPAEELTRRQAAQLEPLLRIPPDAGLAYFPSEGFVHTHQAIDALLSRARAHGARVIVTGGPVSLESGGGRITAVRLPDDGRIHADLYLCCAGWRTPSLLAPLGVTVPLTTRDATCFVARTATSPVPIRRVVHTPDLGLRPTKPDGIRLGAGDIDAALNGTERPDLDRYAGELVRRATEILGGLEVPRPAGKAFCVRPLPVDGLPIVGWLPELGNAYVVVTHSGVTLAPLLARLVAADVLGGPVDELGPYRITRRELAKDG